MKSEHNRKVRVRINQKNVDKNRIAFIKTEEDLKIFINAIENPAEPNATLRKAKGKYLRFLETGGMLP